MKHATTLECERGRRQVIHRVGLRGVEPVALPHLQSDPPRSEDGQRHGAHAHSSIGSGHGHHPAPHP